MPKPDSFSMIARLGGAAIARGLGAISLLLVQFTVARTLVDAEASRIFLVLTISLIATPLSLLGQNSLLVRELPRLSTGAEHQALLRSVGARFARFNVPALIAAMVAVLVLGRDRRELFVVVAVVTLLPAVSLVGHALQGLKRLNTSVMIMNVAMPAFFVGLIGLTTWLSDETAAWTTVLYTLLPVASLIALVAGLLFLAAALRDPAVSDNKEADRVASQSRSDLALFWLVYVMIALNNFLPQLLFRAFESEAEFAYFSTAQRLANIVAFVLIVSNFTVAPFIAEMTAQGRLAELEQMYLRVARATIAIALPVAGFMFVGAEWVLGLFGEDYVRGAPFLRVFCVMQFVNVAVGTTNALLNMGGRTKLLVQAMVAAFVLGLLLVTPYVLVAGSIGFALMAATSLIMQNLFAAAYVRREFGINPAHALVPSLGSSRV